MDPLNRPEKEKIELAEELVEFLNNLLLIDAKAVTALAENRVDCSEELAAHPTVQVHETSHNKCSVGMLGILNGFIGVRTDHIGYLTAYYEDNGTIARFELTRGSRT
jgi:hypothetical protein